MSRGYQQGEHICSIYADRAEQLAVAADFIADGLRHGEQCLYADASAAALDEFRHALKEFGLVAAPYEASRALLLVTCADAHLRGGRFDCEEMLQMLNTTLEGALDAGFTGLRTCGEMSWLLDDAPGSERVVEYEALVNQFFAQARGLGMCQYDRQRLPATLIDHGLATHSSVHIGGAHKANPFYRPPVIAIGRSARPEDVPWKLRDLANQA